MEDVEEVKKKKRTYYSEPDSLVNGLLAVGNKAFGNEGLKNICDLNESLSNKFYSLRSAALKFPSVKKSYEERVSKLLSDFSPQYKEKCEERGLMDASLKGEWKSKSKGNVNVKTVGALFEEIDGYIGGSKAGSAKADAAAPEELSV